jgi:uncharacterized protein (TIGR02147 family)
MSNANYRDYLRREFDARSRANERYSLSIFARDLGLAPSRLSEILSDKQGISREVAARIAALIKLKQDDAEYFCDLVEVEHARSAEKRKLAKVRLEERELDSTYWTLQNDAFHLIADWYHFAILQLVEMKSFNRNSRWIALTLGISRGEAEAAVARLVRLGVLVENKTRLNRSKDFVATTDGVPSSAIRKFHRQVLEKAIVALDKQSIEQRNYSSNFVTISKTDLPRAKDMMKRFRRRFVSELSANDEKDGVYCLSMQFFELTRGLEGK